MVEDKNRPILVAAALCSAAIFVALITCGQLFLEMQQMEAELEEGMGQFKALTDQTWETLFHVENTNEAHRVKRYAAAASSYFGSSANCKCAPSAQNCPKGQPGAPGDRGEPGIPGKSGPPGKPGLSGGVFVFERVKPPCIGCPTGEAGPKGRSGQPGSRPGSDGKAGDNGKPGSDGQPGPKGEPGDHGPAGLAGPTGQSGPPGESVSTWAKLGTPGARGSPGPAGPPGEAGPPGQSAQPGTDGIPGPAGNAGPPGEPGTAGNPGENGRPGEEAPEKNYCPCPPRSEPVPAPAANTPTSPNSSYGASLATRRGVRMGVVTKRKKVAAAVVGRVFNRVI